MLKVQLRADGRIDELKVVRRSGVDFLTTRRRRPFAALSRLPTHPPASPMPTASFRFNFGFIVNLSGRTSFRFYKYQD